MNAFQDAIDLARASIKSDEGLRLKLYRCTANKLSIGYGRNIEDRGISQIEADNMLENDIADCVKDLGSFSFWHYLSDKQQAALINMRFQLGPTGFRAFKKMIKALEIRDWTEAHYQALDSDWHKQTPERAERVAAGLLP